MTAYLAEADTRVAHPQELRWVWKTMESHFGHLVPEQVTRESCKSWITKRRNMGIGDGSIRKGLGIMQAALNRHLGKANPAVIERPAPPPGKDRFLTRDEVGRLLDGCGSRHVRLFVILAIATGARGVSILDLTWDRVDMRARTIDFGASVGNKRRPVTKMNRDAFEALTEARQDAICPYVVHYEGRKVQSVKKAFARAVQRAGLDGVTPHTLRHTAATWMVMAGVSTVETARALGISEKMVETRYGHHHPDFLSRAARATER